MKIERRNLVRKKKEAEKAYLKLVKQIKKDMREALKNNQESP